MWCHKKLNLWDFSGYNLWKNKPTCQKLLLRANCRWNTSPVMPWWLHTNPSKFDSVHSMWNWVKFRKICMESTEQNETSISETICPTMIVFGPQKINFYDVITLELNCKQELTPYKMTPYPGEKQNLRILNCFPNSLRIIQSDVLMYCFSSIRFLRT